MVKIKDLNANNTKKEIKEYVSLEFKWLDNKFFCLKRNSLKYFHEKQNELKIYQIQLQDYRNEINKVFSKVVIMIHFV